MRRSVKRVSRRMSGRLWPLESWFFARPVSFLLATVVLPLVVLLTVTHHTNVAVGRRQALQHLSVAAELAARIIEETLNTTTSFERMLAVQPAVRDALRRGDRAQLGQFLERTLSLIPALESLIVTSDQGEILAAYPPDPGLVGRTLSQDDGFQGAQRGGWHPYVSAVHLREGSGFDKVVEVVVPVVDGDDVVGVIHVQHPVEAVRSWLQKIRIEPGGFLYVVDHQDQLVVYPFQILPGAPKVVSAWPPVSQPVSQSGGTMIFRGGKQAQRWLAAIYPVSSTGWRVVAIQAERDVLRTLHGLLWPMGLLVGLLLPLVFVLSAGLVRWRRLVSAGRGRPDQAA